MARGYTDEADKILNYLVYAPFFPAKPLILMITRRNTEYLTRWKRITFRASFLQFIWYETCEYVVCNVLSNLVCRTNANLTSNLYYMRLMIGLCSPRRTFSIVEAYTFNFKVYFGFTF